MLQSRLLLAARLRSDLENNPELWLPVPLEMRMKTFTINTATGWQSLFSNTDGNANAATGVYALSRHA
jgi:hypothetical protein